ncbi:phosphatase PAP2 family protein [Terriglobus roseus]|uniref:PAP2 superfamily protein n=1 Tax=Terriglobus roseus TaxID=392734 RepID=A0A1H4TJZ0_9BACT|nr:phosphatase PAP2 family protein [Terriglobus roseus]SEC56578.1 PAP2 superfamily protein [Terriglobus roseus]
MDELPDAPSAARAAEHQQGGAPSSVSTSAKDDTPLQDQPHSPVTLRNTPRHMLADAAHIVVSPIYIRTRDLAYLLPLAGATAAAFATDTHTMRDVVSHDTSFNQTAINVSDAGRDGFIAAPAAMFLWGTAVHNEKARETGILASQAWIEAYVADEIVKLSSFRERPLTDNARGNFYIGSSGADSSFISGHSMVAWSSAAVIAGEYHNPWAQLGVYTAASAVSMTRVLGQQHFPSDVLIGSAAGWLIGHYVYRAHHHADKVR